MIRNNGSNAINNEIENMISKILFNMLYLINKPLNKTQKITFKGIQSKLQQLSH